MAHLFTDPVWSATTQALYHPHLRDAPFLTHWLLRSNASTHQAQVLHDIHTSILASDLGRRTVEIEDLEDAAAEAFALFERKLSEAGGASGWFLGSSAALPIDAALFAHCHVVLSLPHTAGNIGTSPKLDVLRSALVRNVTLVSWTRRLEKEYFR